MSDISRQIWDMKYRLKGPDGAPVDKTIEEYLAKTFGIDVDFDVTDALSRLKQEGVVTAPRQKIVPPACSQPRVLGIAWRVFGPRWSSVFTISTFGAAAAVRTATVGGAASARTSAATRSARWRDGVRRRRPGPSCAGRPRCCWFS